MQQKEKDNPVTLNKLARSIRAKCLECAGGMKEEVLNCQLKPKFDGRKLVGGCPLWPYRNISKKKEAYYAEDV